MTAPPFDWCPLTDEQAARLERDRWARQAGRPRFPHVSTAVLRVRGGLNHGAVEDRLTAIVARHDALRTRVRVAGDGSAWQVVRGADSPTFVIATDTDDADGFVRDLVESDWDLRSESPVRVGLARRGAGEHVLAIAVEHLVCDGWSLRQILRELEDGGPAYDYDDGEVVQFPDFVRWQSERLRGPQLDRLLDHWRDVLRDSDPAAGFELPFADDVPADRRRRGAAVQSLPLPPRLLEALTRTARERHATPFMQYLTAFQALLWRYTGRELIPLPVMVAGRDGDGLERSVGWFATRLLLTATPRADMSAAELLAHVRGRTLDAYAHQDISYAQLVRECPGRDTARCEQGEPRYNPDAILNYMPASLNTDVGALEVAGACATLAPEPGGYPPRSTLALTVQEDGAGASAHLRYDTAELDAARASTVLRDYVGVLDWLTTPGDTRLGGVLDGARW